jgi:hypothetical protein
MADDYYFFPPWMVRAYRNIRSATAKALQGKDGKKSVLREWGVGLGIPALAYSLGFSLMLASPDVFWFGFKIAAFACAFLALDWWLLSKPQPLVLRVSGLAVSILAFSLIAWLAFRPLPLTVTMYAESHNYVPNTNVDGIAWKPNYSELGVILSNDTGVEYRNVDIYIRSDIVIADSGIGETINKCVIQRQNPGIQIGAFTLTGKDKNGVEHTVRTMPSRAISSFNRVWCDAIEPHSSVEFTFALIGTFSSGVPLLPNFGSDRVPPKWAIASAQYVAANRVLRPFFPKCFSGACDDMPNSSEASGDPR